MNHSYAWQVLSLKASCLSRAPGPLRAASHGTTHQSPGEAQVCSSEVQGLYSATVLPHCFQDLERHFFMVTVGKADTGYPISAQFLLFAISTSRKALPLLAHLADVLSCP